MHLSACPITCIIIVVNVGADGPKSVMAKLQTLKYWDRCEMIGLKYYFFGRRDVILGYSLYVLIIKKAYT